MGHFYKYNNSEPLQSQASKNQAFKICPEKNTFHPSKKQPISNIAISAACETEGRNARLLRASGNVQQAFLIRLL